MHGIGKHWRNFCAVVRDGPFDIQGGGGWDFFQKNSLFPNRGEKKQNVFNEVKNKKFVLH